jgi:uncharacterized membrane protein YraQ (UPF0718 family)
MFLGSLVSVFGKKKIHSMFAAIQDKDLGVLGIIPASLIGIASPLCMYGTIPICASFSEKGMEEDWLAAFMMSSILLNPQLIFYSAALGPGLLIIRFANSFLCGVCAGLLVRFFYKGKNFFNFSSFKESGSEEASSEETGAVENGFGKTENRDTDPNIFLRFFKNLLRNIKATGPAFLLGLTLSALFQRYVNPDTMAALFGKQRGFGLLMAATVGVPLYVCGGGTIPLLISWLETGMSAGSASAFMITGPAMKITNLGAVKIVMGIKHFVFYIAFAVLFALLTGFLVELGS